MATLVALVLSACGSSPIVALEGTSANDAAPRAATSTTLARSTPTNPTASAPTSAPAPLHDALVWSSCGKHLQCTRLTVPLDYSGAVPGTIALYVKRHPASSSARLGSMLVNPGGPGIPGTTLVDAAEGEFSTDIVDRFDIVGWDPRGTGRSTPAIQCAPDLDPYFSLDPSPDDPAEMQALEDASKDFAATCARSSGDLLAHVSTQDSARDMDAIRAALGEDTITYFGFSYGSFLGATFATMFPQSVRAMVVDGAEDPAGNTADAAIAQASSLERSLDLVLAGCSKNKKCPFYNGGDAEGAFDRLMAKLDTDPISVSSKRPKVGQGVALFAVISQLYSKAMWPTLLKGLAKAQAGDGALLLAMYDGYLERRSDGSWSNVFPALAAINCVDDPGITDKAGMDALAPRYLAAAPHLGAQLVYNFTCSYWPAERVARLALTAAGAGPIVVIGTTGDPITPLPSSAAMASALKQGVLVTVEGEQHTGYGLDDCIVTTIDHYLIDLVPPQPGLVCK